MNAKAYELHAEIVDELKKRKPSSLAVLTESFDANNWPVITLSADATPAAGEKVIVIRTKPIDWVLAKDVLGLASPVHTPHVIQIATEKNFEGTTDNINDILTANELLQVLGTVLSRGTRVEWWQEANGVVPAVTTFNTGSKLSSTFEPSLYWGMKASQ